MNPTLHASSPTKAAADKKQIEEAAAHDPTKAGKIEFFMQYVYLTADDSTGGRVRLKLGQGHALPRRDRVALVQGPFGHYQGQSASRVWRREAAMC